MLPTGMRHCQRPQGIVLLAQSQREHLPRRRRVCGDVHTQNAHVLHKVVGIEQLPAAGDVRRAVLMARLMAV